MTVTLLFTACMFTLAGIFRELSARADRRLDRMYREFLRDMPAGGIGPNARGRVTY